MSDTPRSDEESFSIDRLGVWRYAPDGGYTKASFSRRLERENAALREENRKAHDMACEDAVERYRLNGENAALREDSELLNFLLKRGVCWRDCDKEIEGEFWTVGHDTEWLYDQVRGRERIRAAIDAARKEAKP
jgi:hypothetical protein